LALIGVVAILVWPQGALALSSIPNENTWVTNAAVRAIADNGTTIIIGGDFNYVGPNTGHGVLLSTSTGATVPPFPKVNGEIHAVVSDGFGGWFIGGAFTVVGTESRNYIARILSSGAVSTWYPTNGANAPVRALALAVNASGRTLYAGGDFTSIGGGQRSYVAALNASTGAVKTWNPGADGFVRTLAVSGSLVYMGGDFVTVGADERNHLAAVDNSTSGVVTSWNPDVGPSDTATVYALAVSGATVYAGGDFESIGTDIRHRIAAIGASTGSATTWNPDSNGAVNALALDGTKVYAGGSFTNIGGSGRNRIAALNASGTGTATSWNPDSNGAVKALALDATTVYAGGSFTNIGGSGRNRIAALNANTGAATSWNPNAGDSVNALVVSGSKVYAGGAFSSIGGDSRYYLAALDASSGALTPWKHNANGSVYALALGQDSDVKTLYVGGDFTTISGGTPRNYIASFDAAAGSLNPWNPDGNGTVHALAVNGSTVFAGGKFGRIGGQHRNYIAALDGNGTATSWDPNASDWVLALAVSGNTVYAGGQFSIIGDNDALRYALAALEADTGNATSWDPDVSGYVYALALNGSTIYVGGDFGLIGTEERLYIAAVDVATGIPTSWDPRASGSDDNPSGIVYSLAVSEKLVYTGGDFYYFNDDPANPRPHLASFGTLRDRPSSWNPIVGPVDTATVLALAAKQNTLYVGGSFTSFAGGAISQPYFAQFDGNTTVVALSSFTAKGSAEEVSIAWETRSEKNFAGFNLWRSESQKGPYSKITPGLIPGEGGSTYGASYAYQDDDVKLGKTYFFKLEAIDYGGSKKFFGPVWAMVGSIALVYPSTEFVIPGRFPPTFLWFSQGFDRFQIQFSGDASFTSDVITLPEPMKRRDGSLKDRWLTAQSYKPGLKEWKKVVALPGKGKPIYWRVLGNNGLGRSIASNANLVRLR
jgi:hypothetical protein